VFCAASLGAAVEKTAALEGIAIALNLGGSNALVRQAALGASPDLLLLAGDSEANNHLAPRGYQMRNFASNELVVIEPKTAPRTVSRQFPAVLTEAAEIAVADVATAPLGTYTEDSLKSLGPTKAKRIPLQSAQAVLSSVAMGHASLGIVYRTDALSETRVRVVCAIASNSHRPITYVAALPPNASPQARQLVESLISGQGQKVLAGLGFLPAQD
jgi:molybdate transport system substrate-binding protein